MDSSMGTEFLGSESWCLELPRKPSSDASIFFSDHGNEGWWRVAKAIFCRNSLVKVQEIKFSRAPLPCSSAYYTLYGHSVSSSVNMWLFQDGIFSLSRKHILQRIFTWPTLLSRCFVHVLWSKRYSCSSNHVIYDWIENNERRLPDAMLQSHSLIVTNDSLSQRSCCIWCPYCHSSTYNPVTSDSNLEGLSELGLHHSGCPSIPMRRGSL
jgi:hypothetical protein